MPISSFLKTLARDDTGATAVEYGLIVSLIVIAIIASVRGVANESSAMWGFVQDNVEVVMGEGA